jgi:hypothetical protein
MDRYMTLDNMRTFTIREDDLERRVDNPIMLWYNGYNHFDAIRFVCIRYKITYLIITIFRAIEIWPKEKD